MHWSLRLNAQKCRYGIGFDTTTGWSDILISIMVLKNVAIGLAIIFTFPFATYTTALEKKPKGACIRLDPTEVKLGDIPLDKLSDSSGKVSIKVLNDGSTPLILNKVEGCCGTEIKEYTKAPILPGKEGSIKVYFRIEPKPQTISRVVTVHSNAANAKEIKCPISGSVVLPKPAGRIEF